MSCLELVKLVKTYTYGEIPPEVYRERRRQIVNAFTEEAAANEPIKSDATANTPVKKDDPLESFLASKPEAPASPRKQLYLAVAAGLAVALAIGIGVFLLPSGNPELSVSSAQTQKEGFNPEEQTKAHSLIANFLQVDQWNEENINQFILDWQILSIEERKRANQTAWFGNFKSTIQTRLSVEKKSTPAKDRQRVDLMTSLLATVDPGYFISGGSFFDQPSSTKPGSPAQAMPKAGFSATTPAKKPEKVSAPEQIAASPPAKVTKTLPQKSAQPSPQPNKTVDTVAAEVLLSEFVKSFESGNLTGLMQLFSPDATTNHHASAGEISASYAELFQTTAKRALKFSDFSWKATGDRLEGAGKYLAHLNPKGTNIEQIFTADVSIMVSASRQPALINGLYLTNQQFSTSLAAEVKSAIPLAQNLPPPGEEELKILLQNFISSYNRGDVDALMALFSQEARTNDRSNINGIREDYAQLFQTTKSREIVLSDVNWKFTANKAVANGLFEAKIQPINNRDINIYRGKIRIAVTKYEGGILITQLLHNTQ